MSGFVLPRSLPARRQAGAPAGGWLSFLAAALRAVSTRRQLAQMDARMLKDIGLTRSEALAEAGRAPWDIGPAPR
ncbi:DUF1127 domain-containing protein [Falsiroseomonas sp. CW058]|uniref:DUF1127 domain-containing protein n=1 Tax=Falsiroseomonas sp. CW058 TaxID=3388664 RepID=UPI003D31E596